MYMHVNIYPYVYHRASQPLILGLGGAAKRRCTFVARSTRNNPSLSPPAPPSPPTAPVPPRRLKAEEFGAAVATPTVAWWDDWRTAESGRILCDMFCDAL